MEQLNTSELSRARGRINVAHLTFRTALAALATAIVSQTAIGHTVDPFRHGPKEGHKEPGIVEAVFTAVDADHGGGGHPKHNETPQPLTYGGRRERQDGGKSETVDSASAVLEAFRIGHLPLDGNQTHRDLIGGAIAHGSPVHEKLTQADFYDVGIRTIEHRLDGRSGPKQFMARRGDLTGIHRLLESRGATEMQRLRSKGNDRIVASGPFGTIDVVFEHAGTTMRDVERSKPAALTTDGNGYQGWTGRELPTRSSLDIGRLGEQLPTLMRT